MLVTSLSRSDLLKFLPSGGIMAEVGVLNGHFAMQVATINKPARQHLIDPWGRGEDGSLRRTAAGFHMEERYDAVTDHFAEDIAAGRVVIHRTYSYLILPSFADEFFDWAYVDAVHTYDEVRRDLEHVAPKVKSEGFILGHDFANSPQSRRREFGVVDAVRDFVKGKRARVIMITQEGYPSFVIAMNPDGNAARTFVRNVVACDRWPFELADELLDCWDQIEFPSGDGAPRMLFRISKAVK